MDDQEPAVKRPNDLTERTAQYGEAVIAMLKRLPRSPIIDPLVRQLVRSATSIGANYCEANDADSKKDCKRRINICLREAKETKHWLRMITSAHPGIGEDARRLWQGARELTLIFAAIRKKL